MGGWVGHVGPQATGRVGVLGEQLPIPIPIHALYNACVFRRRACTGSAAPAAQHIDDKRHLLRLWLSTPDARPLPEYFSDLWGSITVSAAAPPGCGSVWVGRGGRFQGGSGAGLRP